jgi:hypothetical protein
MRSPLLPRIFSLAVLLLISGNAIAADDAEMLSRRIPSQSYNVLDQSSVLRHEKMQWFIPLWACDPTSFEVTKVLGGPAPAPFAVKITPKGNNPIDSLYPYFSRLRSIHLLAASLEDAVRMRRALILEVDAMQRYIEKKQGNMPGHLKRIVRSWKR